MGALLPCVPAETKVLLKHARAGLCARLDRRAIAIGGLSLAAELNAKIPFFFDILLPGINSTLVSN